MFLRNFVLNGFLGAVGSMPDYWIILNAAGYMDKGVLTVTDLEDIQEAIDKNNGNQAANGNETTGETAASPDHDAESSPTSEVDAASGSGENEDTAPAEEDGMIPSEDGIQTEGDDN